MARNRTRKPAHAPLPSLADLELRARQATANRRAAHDKAVRFAQLDDATRATEDRLMRAREQVAARQRQRAALAAVLHSPAPTIRNYPQWLNTAMAIADEYGADYMVEPPFRGDPR